MAVIIQRSSAELRRLTNARWSTASSIRAFLADLSGVATPPTVDSTYATWSTYFITENHPVLGNRTVSVQKTAPTSSVYNASNYRAELAELTFPFTSSVLAYIGTGSRSVTNVVFADASNNLIGVGGEDPVRVITSSSSFTYTLNLWGRYAT